MAADQRKKRVNAASLVSCTSREQYSVKRKKVELPQHDLNMRPSISLEWDNKKKSVVSKREQIGISRRHLIPFIEPGPHSHDILADVFSVPQEIFKLENLSEVLSSEVWQSHLSEKERSLLSQLLPKETEPDTVVEELLAGDNFHFGNPLLKWGASLCVGELHPDNILHKEQSLKAGKKAYHSDLQKYHNGMIENLQTWKEKWASCKDSEVDTVQNIWRSRKHAEKSMPQSETRFYDTEENLVATPESCSERAYSSDNQNLVVMHGESQKRKGFLNKISDIFSTGLNGVAVSKKGEKVHRRNIQRGDGAEYMSYIKVSKKQHERVKSSMKHASNSIQPRSLNNVLGSIDALNVQPFERFEEEERKKLHEYWLKLAIKDIPEGFANWRNRQLHRQQLTLSLGEEIIKRKQEQDETTQDEEKEGSEDKLTGLSDDSEEKIIPPITTEEQMANEEAVGELLTEEEDEKEIKNDYIFEEQTHDVDDDEEDDTETSEDEDNVFVEDHSSQQQQMASFNNDSPTMSGRSMITPTPNLGFLQDQHQQQISSSLNSNSHTNSMHCNSTSVRADEIPALVSKYPPVNLNQVDIRVCGGDELPPIWAAAGDVHDSYYRSSATNAAVYAPPPNQELTIGHPQFIQEQSMGMLDLETTDTHDKDSGKVMVHRQSDDLSFFSPYSNHNQDRNELLQSLFKGGQSSNLLYHPHQQHKQHSGGLELIQPGNNNLMMDTAGQFSGNLTEHILHPTSFPQKRLNDLYVHHNIHGSSGYGGILPRQQQQENLGVVNNIHHDWANAVNNNTVIRSSIQQPHNLMNTSSSTSSGGELLSQNWYNAATNPRDGWPSSFHSRSGNINSDQTLFSVLSECNELRPRVAVPSYDASMGERFRNYSGEIGPSTSSNIFLQQSSSTNPLQYLSGHEAAAALAGGGGIKMNNHHPLGVGGWMGLPQQQNSGVQQQESMAKPFLRSWNQQI